MKKMTELPQLVLPRYKEIPDVGLFLDQVVKYINSFLQEYPELQITNAMVSNYVKQKLIRSPIKKSYSRDQIASLLFIVIAKPVLSLDHIRLSLEIAKNDRSSEEAYTQFIDVFERNLKDPDSQSNTRESSYEWALNHIVSTVIHKLYLDYFFKEEFDQKK